MPSCSLRGRCVGAAGCTACSPSMRSCPQLRLGSVFPRLFFLAFVLEGGGEASSSDAQAFFSLVFKPCLMRLLRSNPHESGPLSHWRLAVTDRNTYEAPLGLWLFYGKSHFVLRAAIGVSAPVISPGHSLGHQKEITEVERKPVGKGQRT